MAPREMGAKVWGRVVGAAGMAASTGDCFLRVSLHHLAITETTPAEFAEIAAALRCDHICLFVKIPPGPASAFPYVLPRVQSVGAAHELKKRLDGLGLSVWNVDTFMVQPGVEIADYHETLEIAAVLGARTINALNLFPAEATVAAAETLGSFSTLAAQAGLTVVLEWFRYSSTKTLGAAVDLIRLADKPNIQLNVDILHLMRNGGQPADLAAVDPALIHYAQICDGPIDQPERAQDDEGVFNRNFPGEGEFPLVGFVQHLPPDAVLSIEAPVNRLRSSLTPMQRATRAVAGTRRILAEAGC
jgi:sugar phosphate isomerase/epimerase